MAAGGMLEGLHRNSRAQQLDYPGAGTLEHIISGSCRSFFCEIRNASFLAPSSSSPIS